MFSILRRVLWLSVISRKYANSSVGAGVSFPLTRVALTKLRLKAVRRGCWFRDLKCGERKLLDLIIRVVERVYSFVLAKLVSRIIDKLCEAMESRIYRLMRIEGQRMVLGLSEIAQSWGYGRAKSWVMDRGFMQFLLVTNLGVFEGS
jgi:hypothetical protein